MIIDRYHLGDGNMLDAQLPTPTRALPRIPIDSRPPLIHPQFLGFDLINHIRASSLVSGATRKVTSFSASVNMPPRRTQQGPKLASRVRPMTNSREPFTIFHRIPSRFSPCREFIQYPFHLFGIGNVHKPPSRSVLWKSRQNTYHHHRVTIFSASLTHLLG